MSSDPEAAGRKAGWRGGAPSPPVEPSERESDPRVGVCVACRHHRVIVSGKGSIFHLCERSRADPTYPRYPPLPVLACHGLEPVARR